MGQRLCLKVYNGEALGNDRLNACYMHTIDWFTVALAYLQKMVRTTAKSAGLSLTNNRIKDQI